MEMGFTESLVNKIEAERTDAVLVIKNDGHITTYTPLDGVTTKVGENIPANCLALLGIIHMMKTDPEFINALIAAGTEHILMQEKPGALSMQLNMDGRLINLNPTQLKELIRREIIYACTSPAHFGMYHFTDTFAKKFDNEEAAWAGFEEVVKSILN